MASPWSLSSSQLRALLLCQVCLDHRWNVDTHKTIKATRWWFGAFGQFWWWFCLRTGSELLNWALSKFLNRNGWLPGKWSGSSKVGFVSSQLLKNFHMANDISKWSVFRKTVESEIKNGVIFLIFGRWFDELDTGSKEEEYGKNVFLFKWELSWLVINDHQSDSSYSSNKIILYLSPVFLDL